MDSRAICIKHRICAIKYLALIVASFSLALFIGGSTSIAAPIAPKQCSDKIDNDADMKTDYPSDPGCISKNDNSEYPDPAPPPPGADQVAPVTQMVSPANSSTASGTITLSATERDDTGIAYGSFYIDSLPGRPSSNAPCATNTTCTATLTLDTTTLADGTHVVHYQAVDNDNPQLVGSSNTVTFTTSNVVVASPYFYEHFSGVFNTPTWQVNPTPQWVSPGSDGAGQAVRVFDCASPSITQLCQTSGSVSGQYAFVSTISSPTNDVVHAGRVPGSGTTPENGDGRREETWFRFHIRFPSNLYVPTPGTTWLYQWHVDGVTEANAQSLGAPAPGAYSNGLLIFADGATPTTSPRYTTTPGTNPRFMLQTAGGQIDSRISGQGSISATYVRKYTDSVPIVLGHWYNIVMHVVFAPITADPHIQVWIDNTLKWDVVDPTEYTRTNGTFSYGEYNGLMQYRYWANWESSVDFDEYIWGPTSASIGFTP